MKSIRLRTIGQLEYREPGSFLVRLREIEREVEKSNTPNKIKNLRTNQLKPWHHAREAALFCYGMGQRCGRTIYFANRESQDYDFVASWLDGDTRHFAPVQLKEVVSRGKDLETIIQNLFITYPDSKDLTVAIHLNQQGRFEPDDVLVPPLNIGSLWVFASISSDQSRWCLWGNFLETPVGTAFDYPS